MNNEMSIADTYLIANKTVSETIGISTGADLNDIVLLSSGFFLSAKPL